MRNLGGPAYALRTAPDGELREKDSAYDMRELGDVTTAVGHVYFHPGTRKPPIPPAAEVEAFAAANPDLPIVVDYTHSSPCEVPHIVLARFVEHGDGRIGLDRNGNVFVSLFTIAADNYSRAFDPATHIKGGDQKEGVDIFDWEMVNFDSQFRKKHLSETYRCIYGVLRSLAAT